VVLLVIFAQIVSRLGLKNLGTKLLSLESSFEEHVKMLSDQVKLISEKLAYLTPNEQRSVLVNNHKKASKQVWVKKEDNLCLVSHTALKILDTCL